VTALRLTGVSFACVEYVLLNHAGRVLRPIVVRVGSAPDWHRAVQFPSIGTDGTETTGDDDFDAEIRALASEELVRHEAAVQAAHEGRWIA